MRKRNVPPLIYGVVALVFYLCGRTGQPLLASPADSSVVRSTVPGQDAVPSYMDLVRYFDYNSRAPLDIQEKLIAEDDSLKYFEISYVNPRRWRILANLVEPIGTGPYPAIIYLCANQSDFNAFFNEARRLAQNGMVVMLMDTSAVQIETAGYSPSLNNLTIQSVVNVRRAVDLLSVRPKVDGRRVGFIGQAAGANLGGIIAGIEKRIRALILISADARPSSTNGKENLSSFLDGANYLGYAAPAFLLFQYSEKKGNISRETAMNCFQCASQPKTIKWYSGPPLGDVQARTDRLAWLREQLLLN